MNYQQEEMNESLLSSLKQAWNDFDSIVEKLTLALIHYFFTLSIMKSHLIKQWVYIILTKYIVKGLM